MSDIERLARLEEKVDNIKNTLDEIKATTQELKLVVAEQRVKIGLADKIVTMCVAAFVSGGVAWWLK